MNNKIYVLIPVYNVENVLKSCIDSVLNQTYRNWEMILVDDGSTDTSGKICDIYSKKDSRIRVIHQKNSGSSIARDTAVKSISESENSYCVFIDSDDIIPYDAFQRLVNSIKTTQADIVYGEMQKFVKFNKPRLTDSLTNGSPTEIIEKDEIVEKVYSSCFGYLLNSVSLCGKLFKTEIIVKAFENVHTHPKYFADDLNMNLEIIPHAERIALTGDIVYFYRFGGGTGRFMKSFIDDTTLLYHRKKEYAQKYGVSPYCISLIDVEMKNLALTYLVMCIRTKTYPHGRLEDEIEYLFSIPEYFDTICSIPEKLIKTDPAEIPGFTPAFVNKDINKIKSIALTEATKGKLKRFIKKFI